VATCSLKLFTGRNDPGGRDEQFEKFYLIALEASADHSNLQAFAVGDPRTVVPMEVVLDELVEQVAIRNPDFYEYMDGSLLRLK